MTENELSHRDRVHAMFVQHSPRIRGFILSIQPNMSRADDVLQETFLTVSSKADEFVSGTNFIAWACSIARFKVLEDSKRTQRSTSLLAPEVIEAVCATHAPLAAEDHDAQLGALQQCMSSLSPHTRRAIELRYARAHTAPEIATLLGWTTDSVYVVLSRARGALLKCISARLDMNG